MVDEAMAISKKLVNEEWSGHYGVSTEPRNIL